MKLVGQLSIFGLNILEVKAFLKNIYKIKTLIFFKNSSLPIKWYVVKWNISKIILIYIKLFQW